MNEGVQKIGNVQTMVLASFMLAVSRVDGEHEAEKQLIAAYYQDNREEGMPGLEEVAQHVGLSDLTAVALKEPGFAEEVVRMCIMTGLADGSLSEAEWEHIRQVAVYVGVVAPGRLEAIRQEVKDLFIASLANLPVIESAAEIAKAI